MSYKLQSPKPRRDEIEKQVKREKKKITQREHLSVFFSFQLGQTNHTRSRILNRFGKKRTGNKRITRLKKLFSFEGNENSDMAHCYFTRLNLNKMGPLQFCLPVFLGIHRNPIQK